MKKPAAIALILFGCLGPAGAAVQDPWDAWNTPGEVRDLILNAAARDRMGSEYDSLLWSGRLTRGQQTDFLAFLGEFDFRIAAQCRKLHRQNPGKDFSQLPCPRGSAASAPELASIDIASERTPEESVAALDAELASGLGEYDEMLLREQKKTASRSPTRSQSSGWGGDPETGSGEMRGAKGDSEGETGSGSQESSSEGEEGEYGEEREADSTGGQRATDRSHSSRPSEGAARDERRKPPEDIPDGSDDDVVARQIREAAEKEPDPRLRKKLWEEYRRYKTARR
jgi:hypothetical protein